ncbi:MAG TPA: T9SS type A sorting domain-containing protein, partial [Chitinophagales bacterium]|nr:T9SS type A sorting domain-containing protein [Chitinophagales bacterium]
YIPTHSAVVKYKPNGVLDSSFSADGTLTTFFSNMQSHAMAVQPDGKIVLAGEVYAGSSFDFGIMRLKSNGSLDSSFQNAIAYTDFDGKDDYARAIALQSDGKIVVAGFSHDNALNGYRSIARYNPDGTIDSSFNGGKISVSGSSNAMALQSDGAIVLGEHSVSGTNLDFGVSRYLPIGDIDFSFGTNGESSIDISGTTDQCTSIAIQQDGKIVTAGHSWDGAHQNISVARFNSDGSLDVTFGGDGSVDYDISGIDDYCHAVAIQSDGKILLAGGTFTQPPYEDILLMRLISGIGVGEQTIPNPSIHFTLFPNPAARSTAIEFILSSPTKIRIDVFDLLGNKIKCVLNETQLTGEQKIILNTFDLQNGLYFLRFYADEASYSRKLMVTH